ncbi:hypothetical protein HF521_015132 [Silurus meridionalis]|uniref:Uncharacterized protein n=1 Tax=Silurus meridionalis TaxID=175797 RepID=A0A8T0A4L7_SILME|nr:hypothetical protein HF521_015132 [Silurus meridionalis]
MEEEGKRGDEEVITVVIYKTAGGYGSEREDADTNSNLQTQRPGWILFSSSIYKISTEKKSWTESRQACRERGAELVLVQWRTQ